MTVCARIAVFAVVLVGVFAASLSVGGNFGPNPDITVPHPSQTSEHTGHGP